VQQYAAGNNGQETEQILWPREKLL